MSKSKEVIEYVKALRERKLQLEDLVTQESPVFSALGADELQARLTALEAKRDRLRQVYATLGPSDTDSLLLSRVLLSGRQVSDEMAKLRELLAPHHPSPAAFHLESQVESVELEILRFEFELEERGTTTLLDKLMGTVPTPLPVKPGRLEVGALIDARYRIEALLSQGERGAVYSVSDQNTPQRWVVKETWGRESLLSAEQIAQIDLAVRRLSTFRHPSLPRIVDAMAENGRYFLVVDALEGHRLDHLLQAGGPLEVEVALPLGIQLAELVRYLHQQTPPFTLGTLAASNLIVEASGRIKVSSFGLAQRADIAEGAADNSTALTHDTRELCTMTCELLGSTATESLSSSLRDTLLSGLEGRVVDLDALLALLSEEMRRLKPAEPEASVIVGAVETADDSESALASDASVADAVEVSEESQPDPSLSERRGSKLSLLFRGVKKVVGKISTTN